MNELDTEFPGVCYAAPKDPTARHKNAFGYHLGWGYVGKSMARKFHLGIDRYLVQIEVFGYYVGLYR